MTATVLMVHPSAELYGSDRMFAESVRAVTEHGGQAVVALPADGPLAAVLREHGARVVVCRTPVLRKSGLRPGGFARLLLEAVRAVAPMVRLLREVRPRVVYVSTVTVPLWPVLARLAGARVVYHVHEAEDDAPRPVRVALAAPLLAASLVVVNGPAAANFLLRSVPRLGNRIRSIPNGVAGPATLPAPREPDDRPLRLVLVGRLSPRKGTDVAVRAVEQLVRAGHDVTLDLVGSAFTGYEWFVDDLRRQIADAGLADRVRFAGFTADVWRAYAAADIALVPSRVEPFGNTAVEAQLAGVPVIVTDAQGLPETVDHGTLGTIVPREDAGAIADAVLALSEDWRSTIQVAAQAQRAAAELFAPRRYRREIAAALGIQQRVQ